MGLPIVGGGIDSVGGILTGTGFGIAPQRAALLLSAASCLTRSSSGALA
jgi:hypothetical protein